MYKMKMALASSRKSDQWNMKDLEKALNNFKK